MPPALSPTPVRGQVAQRAAQRLPALGKELFQLPDPLILRHEG
jgi:hypothetical protein